jgi:hypothetical protein
MPYTTSATAAILKRRFTSSASSSSSNANTNNTNNTPSSSFTLLNCRQYIGPPLSREDAIAKLQRSGMFRQAVTDFSTTTIPEETTIKKGNNDLEHAAVEFEYGMRLRNCLSAASSPVVTTATGPPANTATSATTIPTSHDN